MGWQEELRLLDAKLADGSLTPAQHRKMRDELLAAASGGGSTSPVAAPRRESNDPAMQETAVLPRIPVAGQPMPAGQAKPPPHAVSGGRPAPKVVENRPTLPLGNQEPKQPPNAAALLSGERPTTAPSPADQRATESMAVPPRGLARGRSVLSPVAAHQPTRPYATEAQRSWTTPPPQYDYDQEDHGPRRNGSTWLFLAVGVLLAGGLLAGGVWLLSKDEPASNAAAPPPAASAPAQSSQLPPPPADLPLEQRLPELPGTQNANNSTMSVDKGTELKLYAPETANMFKQNGASEVVYRSSSDGTDGYLVMVVPAGSPEGAKNIAEQLRKAASETGFTQLNLGLPPGKSALAGSNTVGRMNATWYTSENLAVAVWVSQGFDKQQFALGERLKGTLAKVETALPPS
ncbi:hypothetical protein [Amycolatopsis sp. YIM 10]|uniref:hypothetical protein n=1 Tax=Amycolatopsis sp. YIM 10 TaxID=2653857 RepID=UPI00128FD7E3|nr:hypothetical protein [Amycolatopsis sp. YIM 10]QFU85353.1 hypothetical protein YIM_00595 [Amycolatopsis sp. YIM 10]